DEFIHKSTIKMESYDEKIFISNGKLFIYHEKLGSITKWDINASKFEAYFLYDNSFSVDNMKLSDNGVLLFVYGKKLKDNLREGPYSCISIYSVDRGIRLTTFTVDAVYLIAPDIGARLLIVYHKSYHQMGNYRYSICDPFSPYSPDKPGTLVVKDLIKDLIKDAGPNWISYLRNTLKDFDSIYISSIGEQIIGLIVKNKQAVKVDIDKELQYSKHLVTWTLKYNPLYEKKNTNIFHIFLTAKFKNDEFEQVDKIQIVPEAYINSGNDVKGFVKECACLDNDDLVMVTILGVLIWTFNRKDYKITLNYRWDDEGDSWEWDRTKVIKLFYEIDEKTFDINNFDIKELKKRSYFLPPPSYISMIRYNHPYSQSHPSDPPKDDRFFFNELIEKHINDKFFIILYGQKLVEDIIKEDEETRIYYSVHISEIHKLISYINSNDWERSTKPIITKIMKAIKDEKRESELDKVKKMIENVANRRDQKQASEVEEIKKFIEEFMKKLENKSS
ncbi:10617_t:CDS:2, partial [Gigaspora rosea]